MMFSSVHLASWARNVRALLVQLRAPGPGGRPIAGDDVEVWQQPGVRANPVIRPTSEALVVELANGQRVAFYVDKARQTGGVEPETGGVALVGDAAPAAAVYLRADGAVEVTAAAGRKVVVQGGAQPFVRGTDFADALGAAVDATKVLNTAVGVFATAVGAGTPLFPAVATAAATLNTAIGVANAALDALKLARAGYLSQRFTGD